MNKDQWGIKRVCLSCAARFYDLNKSPILCPACSSVFDPEYLTKRKPKISQEKNTSADEVTADEIDEGLIEDEGENLDELDESDGDISLNEEKS
ncbi:MAG: TIGR02300 family protein [Holosporaceae bacterium]|nr:TIGR02300 family protein [Holosporaceae bacterium]